MDGAGRGITLAKIQGALDDDEADFEPEVPGSATGSAKGQVLDPVSPLTPGGSKEIVS